MTGIILAGGTGSRMKMPKGLIAFDENSTIMERTVEILRSIFREVIIVTNMPDIYSKFDAKIIKDLVKGKGPLGGIYSGLLASASWYNFVCGCDMPFVKPALIKYLAALPKDYDILLPELDSLLEPLFAIYSKRCIPIMARNVKLNRLKIQDIFSELVVKRVGEREIDRFDPEHISFFNVNTRHDLIRAINYERAYQWSVK